MDLRPEGKAELSYHGEEGGARTRLWLEEASGERMGLDRGGGWKFHGGLADQRGDFGLGP